MLPASDNRLAILQLPSQSTTVSACWWAGVRAAGPVGGTCLTLFAIITPLVRKATSLSMHALVLSHWSFRLSQKHQGKHRLKPPFRYLQVLRWLQLGPILCDHFNSFAKNESKMSWATKGVIMYHQDWFLSCTGHQNPPNSLLALLHVCTLFLLAPRC